MTDVSIGSVQQAAARLQSLYESHGYGRYKMSKFEEYDLYVRNKDFLISDSVITFTDTNGKLMALKPDVTLSIIKNTKDLPGFVQKVYYNENVYRISKGTHTFKEIMQTGLECMGDLDDHSVFEVLKLACLSLCAVSESCVLDLSHMALVSLLLDSLPVDAQTREDMVRCIGEKNAHELQKLCVQNGVDEHRTEQVLSLVSLYGAPDDVLPKLKAVFCEPMFADAISRLEAVTQGLKQAGLSDKVRLDCSVIHDMKYYNGFVCKGFLEGVPNSVLSGGQYDNLMHRMGKRSGAIGFAVYLDEMERLLDPAKRFDVDTVLLYDEGTPISQLENALQMLRAGGVQVSAQRSLPESLRCRRLLKLENGEVKGL